MPLNGASETQKFGETQNKTGLIFMSCEAGHKDPSGPGDGRAEPGRHRSPWRRIWDGATLVLVAVVVALAVLLVGVRLVGLTPYVVLSGSMEPTYHVGALIYVEDVDPAEIQVGDPITFVLDEDLNVATHRVIAISEDGEHFTTQGDANDAPDGTPVYYKNLVGRPVFTIPYLGYFSHWISQPPGTYVAGTAAAVLLILLFLPNALDKAAEADRRDAARKRGDGDSRE